MHPTTELSDRDYQQKAVPHPTRAAHLLTPDEVAEVTGLSTETLAQWRSQRRGIPFLKISRNCVRYRQDDLQQWLQSRLIITTSDNSSLRR
ncbi:MAG: helix-turn-helix transcriptional regulator [Terriglobia bacterium]